MTETETTRRNHEYSYNKYYTMPSREELHRGYGGNICESDFNITRGKNQSRSINADKIGCAWSFDIRCLQNIEKRSRKVEENNGNN